MKNIFIAALVLIGLGGCVPSEKVPGSGGEVIQLKQGTVGSFRELKIGVTNLIETEYADAAGAKKKGLAAVLALFIDGNPPREKDVQLRPGQKAAFGKFSVYVEEIRGTTKGLVTLRVE